MKYITYRSGYKYQLDGDYHTKTQIHPSSTINTPFITLTPDGRLSVWCGYAWDGPSGPTWDTKNSMRGSLEHDVKYQLIHLGLVEPESKAIADKEFRIVLLEDGMCSARAWVWFRAVDRFGLRHMTRAGGYPVQTAPKQGAKKEQTSRS